MLSNIGWADAWSSMLGAFVASAVELVEELTVILAIDRVRGWRNALLGTGIALCILFDPTIVFGRAPSNIPLGVVQVLVGALLLLCGQRCLHKVTLRSISAIPLRDEPAAFGIQVETLHGQLASMAGWTASRSPALQITMLEGFAVVFIVIALAAGGVGSLASVSVVAVAVLLMASLFGDAVGRPLAQTSENMLKFAVGVLIAVFGVFWFGEGVGVVWPCGDLAILALVAGFLAVPKPARALFRVRHVSQAIPLARNVP